MAIRFLACAQGAALIGVLTGCASSPLDNEAEHPLDVLRPGWSEADVPPLSAYRAENDDDAPTLEDGSSPDDYIRYALYHSPRVEAAYQRWLAATEELPQVSALPDPRLSFGFFVEEVETRTGPQQARINVSQSFPWPGILDDREDAAARAARAAWRRFESARLAVAEQVVETLHELAYLDAAIRITRENLDLLGSFEEIVRAQYRVGAGSHPELVRVQVELGQLEDRLAQLRAMRPAYAAELNAALDRPADHDVPSISSLPGRVAAIDGPALAEIASSANPALLALDEQMEQQRALAEAARKEGLPDFTVGLDYIITADAQDPSIPESGDDPIMISLGVTLPIWRDAYDAGVREALARRLAFSHDRTNEANDIAASIQRAWFDHTDANRRVRLYNDTLIPKAEESLRASLAAFRAGEANFLDVLDTERTLLEFAISAERARADRGQALARLNALVGAPVPTKAAETTSSIPNEEQP